MKKIEAIIRKSRQDIVQESLWKRGFTGMTVTEVIGSGSTRRNDYLAEVEQKGYRIDLRPKVKLEIFCNDEDAETIIGIIMSNACTNSVGDGRIFVLNVEEAIRIRTGERGESIL